MYSPQEAILDFKKEKYKQENLEFLAPIYDELFQEIANPVIINEELIESVNTLRIFLDGISKNVSDSQIDITDKKSMELLEKQIDQSNIESAVNCVSKIVDFIKKDRTNVNGIQILLWSLFNETSRLGLIDNYEGKPENIRERLMSFEFLGLVLKYPGFIKIALDDLLMPAEFFMPTRRQGGFDIKVFKAVAREVNIEMGDFSFEPFKDEANRLERLKNSTNWIICQSSVQRLSLPIPPNGKIPDFIAKIDNKIFIGAHKEQTFGGGGQDNQAEDAAAIFRFTEEQVFEYREKFNTEDINFCVVLELYESDIETGHWRPLLSKVEDPQNKNLYLLSGYQLSLLLKSI